MAFNPQRYRHHNQRLNNLVAQSIKLNQQLYNASNGYWNDDLTVEPLKRRLWRLHQLTNRALRLRDRYASQERWSLYRAWP